MDVGKLLGFIYFTLFIISVNFPDQLVTDMSTSFEKLSSLDMGL